MANNAIITEKARIKLMQARAGAIVLPKIIGMAFGKGGVDSGGNVLTPAEDQAELFQEIFRKAIDGYTFIGKTVCRYECTLKEEELAGENISEVGLYDSEGELMCIKTFKQKGKDDDLEMTFTLDDIF